MILRLGCGLVGWLLVFAHALLIAVIPAADCSRELWGVSLLFAGLALVGSLLLAGGLGWRSQLRWCALPAAALWLRGLWIVIGLAPASLAGAELCAALAGAPSPEPAPVWQRAWAPVQLAAIAACAFGAWRYWRPEDAGGPTPPPPR